MPLIQENRMVLLTLVYGAQLFREIRESFEEEGFEVVRPWKTNARNWPRPKSLVTLRKARGYGTITRLKEEYDKYYT